MKLIGVNSGHHSSAALLENFKIETFIEGERFDGVKYGFNPYEGLTQLIINTSGNIDYITAESISGESSNFIKTFFSACWNTLIQKKKKRDPLFDKTLFKLPTASKFQFELSTHHFYHAINAFFQCGKSEGIIIVSDGAGTSFIFNDDPGKYTFGLCEYTSFFHFKKNKKDIIFNIVTKKLAPVLSDSYRQNVIEEYKKGFFADFDDSNSQWIETNLGLAGHDLQYISARRGPGFLFEAVCNHLGLDINDAGKLMGLASYGDYKSNLPNLVNQQDDKNSPFSFYIDKDIVIDRQDTKSNGFLNDKKYPDFLVDSEKWQKDENNFDQKVADIAALAQHGSEQLSWEDIEYSLKLCEEFGTKNIIATGGYYLNVVNNYKIRKKLNEIGKSDYYFYVDPLSSDAGTAIGLALWGQYCMKKEKDEILSNDYKLFDNLYLGIPRHYNKHQILSYDDFEVYDTSVTEVAKLLADKNIVSIFQSRSEAGPRALGNRSILYDPTDPNGRNIVNKVKKREWYRPFAGSILHEYAEQYFDMQGLEESPYMMFAVDVWEDKKASIPSIVHVDGTCRIQTVKREQNSYYYDLIEEFYQITGTPILFNTSFNLAGDALVETLDDAIYTMRNSDINYMYMPENNFLIKKNNSCQ